MSVKDEVLRALTENKGSSISGEQLAEKLGVSRTAVWKAVKALRENGYTILSVTNKGYSLPPDADILSAEAVSALMRTTIPVRYYETVTSTNEKAKELVISEGAEYGVVIANSQTGGKGRLGREFVSPAGAGIYMSIIAKPTFDISRSVLVTTAAAVAAAKTLEDLYGLHPQIKWVNDIYLNGKKIIGILTEAMSDFESGRIDRIIIGIGINCFESSLPAEAASSYGWIGGDISRARIAAELIDNFMPMLENISERGFIEDYRRMSMVTGRDILVYKSGTLGEKGAVPLKARAVGIDNDGGLIIEYDGHRETLSSGEISIRFDKGESK